MIAHREHKPYLGLKTSSRQKMWGSTGTLTSDKTQSYGYDSALDYLISAYFTTYIGSSPPASGEYWYYDAAGNRYTNSGLSDHTYDNLNRMTASPGYSYDNHPGASSDGDVLLGNRRWRNYGSSGAVRYKWDSTNRLLQTASANSGGEYKYRADGMRVKKVTGFLINWVPPSGEVSGYYDDEQDANFPTYRYFYDGQMCFEDDYTVAQPGEPPTTAYSGNRYGLGARGIDYVETFAQSGSAIIETGRGFPVYDAHGNMVSTVGRTIVSGALTAYSVSNSREFGPWGDVRTGSGTGFPTQRYCASIGHVQDDESGLIYMRARYYEPGTGRFISEDPAQNGKNWTVYCGNNPIGRIDYSGRSFFQIAEIFEAIMQLFNIRDNIRVGLYGISNPGEFQVGKALGAMALNLLIDTIMGVGVTAIAEAMFASFTLGPLGIAAGLVCIFMIAAIMIVCYLAEEQINEKLVYGG